ncbi:Na(+)/H(+) exchange regulatory cofactor NHE-RF2 [Anopheles cruzii]|uniref:Na(+)/H(+) exchange regulatory cofactor NHE-RF2 n=1 Tax=Anopheles cruzii TaxID=68878 RepID=UPI0022EC2532|nr:Na(+)/H(+) exchange regulatory cofactor NHE-RF2 [Anopheles cruzii]
MSSKSNGATAAAAANGVASPPKYEARLCHVVKRADFDGYGFNLHAEKGRPGQYIGKVDDGSPAEAAGLRQGDRIIEVNSHNITTETHKKVVELIKAVPNETKLLVIDPRADANDIKTALARAATAPTTGNAPAITNNNNNNTAATANGTSNGHHENGHHVVAKENGSQKKAMAAAGDTKVEVEEKTGKSNGVTNNNNNNNHHHHQHNNNNGSVTNSATMDKIIDDTKKSLTVTDGAAVGKMALNGQPVAAPVPAAPVTAAAAATAVPATEGKKLNLSMTAAEMRAQLAARKKYDPKNEVCDLRKKYEIIQKM